MRVKIVRDTKPKSGSGHKNRTASCQPVSLSGDESPTNDGWGHTPWHSQSHVDIATHSATLTLSSLFCHLIPLLIQRCSTFQFPFWGRKAGGTIRTKHSQFVRCIAGQMGIIGWRAVVDLRQANISMTSDTIWKMRVNNPSITYIMRRSQYKPLNTTACRLSPGTTTPASGITDVFTGQAPVCPIWVCEAPGSVGSWLPCPTVDSCCWGCQTRGTLRLGGCVILKEKKTFGFDI